MFKKIKNVLLRCKYSRVIDLRCLYQYWEQHQLSQVLTRYRVDCVFDVGANRGQYAQMLRKKVGFKGLIISFEPIPELFMALQEIAKNDSNWIIIEAALARENGEESFNVMVGDQFSSLSTPIHDDTNIFTEKNRAVKRVTVKTETLASAYNRLQPQYHFTKPFLKLDTQGYDTHVLQASQEVLSQFIGLQSELSIKRLYRHSLDFRDAISLYQSLGFTLSAFVPNNEGHFPVLVEADCIMVRDDLIVDRHATG